MPNAKGQPDVKWEANGQGRGTTDAIGPSWYDVRQLALELERLYGRRVGFVLGPGSGAGSWESQAIQIRAYLAKAGPWGDDVIWAQASFGGASGFRTIAGACHSALSWLWSVAAQRGLFLDL